MFYFGYKIYRLVGIAFFGFFGFHIFFNFLSLSVFVFLGFREVSFFSTNMAEWFSDWTFVFRIPVWCIALSAVLFFCLFFGLLPNFPLCVFLYSLFFYFFLGLLLELPLWCSSCSFFRMYFVVLNWLLSVYLNLFLSVTSPVILCLLFML